MCADSCKQHVKFGERTWISSEPFLRLFSGAVGDFREFVIVQEAARGEDCRGKRGPGDIT